MLIGRQTGISPVTSADMEQLYWLVSMSAEVGWPLLGRANDPLSFAQLMSGLTDPHVAYLRADGSLIGFIAGHDTDEHHRATGVGVFVAGPDQLGRELRGTRLAVEPLGLYLHFLFSERQFQLVHFAVPAGSGLSRGLSAWPAAKPMGTLVQHVYANGSLQDVAMFGISASDWDDDLVVHALRITAPNDPSGGRCSPSAPILDGTS